MSQKQVRIGPAFAHALHGKVHARCVSSVSLGAKDGGVWVAITNPSRRVRRGGIIKNHHTRWLASLAEYCVQDLSGLGPAVEKENHHSDIEHDGLVSPVAQTHRPSSMPPEDQGAMGNQLGPCGGVDVCHLGRHVHHIEETTTKEQ